MVAQPNSWNAIRSADGGRAKTAKATTKAAPKP
jgi:hypothetical protein